MRLKEKILREFKAYWINVLYITVFFSIFIDYRRLILAHYQISYKAYGISLINGLVLAKVILVAEHLGLGRRFEDKPLIFPTLYKSFLFTLCVAVLSVVESLVRDFFRAGASVVVPDAFLKCFSYEWFAGMLIVLAAFIPFFGIRELSKVLGEGKISELFFRRKAG